MVTSHVPVISSHPTTDTRSILTALWSNCCNLPSINNVNCEWLRRLYPTLETWVYEISRILSCRQQWERRMMLGSRIFLPKHEQKVIRIQWNRTPSHLTPPHYSILPPTTPYYPTTSPLLAYSTPLLWPLFLYILRVTAKSALSTSEIVAWVPHGSPNGIGEEQSGPSMGFSIQKWEKSKTTKANNGILFTPLVFLCTCNCEILSGVNWKHPSTSKDVRLG